MGSVIHFEERAVASLRERLGAVESANEDLVAFARGHSGAVVAIQRAVLAAIEADSIEALLATVTQQWPRILGIDSVALALVIGDQAYRADRNGVAHVAPQLVDKAIAALEVVELREVERGHALFGPDADAVRAEALIRVENEAPWPHGLLALGQYSDQELGTRHGAALLLFLGQSLGAIIRRWLTLPTD